MDKSSGKGNSSKSSSSLGGSMLKGCATGSVIGGIKGAVTCPGSSKPACVAVGAAKGCAVGATKRYVTHTKPAN